MSRYYYLQGGHIGNRIYNLSLTAGPGYPVDPPLIKFTQKVAIPCVNNKGQVGRLAIFLFIIVFALYG